VSDTACRQLPDPAEHKVSVFNADGLGVLPSKIAVGGLPSWVAAGINVVQDDGHNPTTGCAYATLTDLSNVVSLRVSKNYTAAVVSNVSAAAPPMSLVNPVHLAVEPATGTLMTAAFYHGPDDATESPGAGVVVLTVAPDTCEIKVAAFTATTGHSVNPARQGTSHVHSTMWDLTDKKNMRFFACDLGTDSIIVFEVSPQAAAITETSRYHAPPGSGPRHMAMHPTLPVAYLVSEMANSITVFTVDPSHGNLTPVQNISLLPNDHDSGFSKAAEIVITKDGSTVIASNRGVSGIKDPANMLFVYKVDQITGHLTETQREPSGTRFPRGIALSPGDKTLVVASQGTSSFTTFDLAEGALKPSKPAVDVMGVPNPTTAAFVVLG